MSLDYEFTVETEGLTKYYGEVLALDDITVKFPKGAVAFLGPNGSGKTTLIKILFGLLEPTRGSFKVLGVNTPHELYFVRQRHVGYMPEIPSLITGISGVKFVSHYGQLSGLPYSLAMRRAHEVLDYVGLEEERYRKIQEYSSGMKQRLLFAQALVHDPELLILDEPTAGLDPQGRSSLLALIRELVQDYGKHLIISTHILQDTERLCDHVVFLNKGRIAFEGRLEELKQLVDTKLVIKVTDQTALIQFLNEQGVEYVVRTDEVITSYKKQLIDDVLELAYQKKIGLMKITEFKADLDELFMELVRKNES